jgi:hypothetical protein
VPDDELGRLGLARRDLRRSAPARHQLASRNSFSHASNRRLRLDA